MKVQVFLPLLVAPVLALCAGRAVAQTKGMVGANDGTVTIFDADTNTPITTLALPGAGGLDAATGDCSITADGTRGFVTDFTNDVHVIDLTTDSLAAGPNPVPIANPGEDTSISPDGLYVVVCDGSARRDVAVIEIATQTQVSTFTTGSDCNSVDVCDDGSVLITSANSRTVRRLTIDGAGALTDTGDLLALFAEPNNVACAPGSATGIVINRGSRDILSFADIRSFKMPGLTVVDSRGLAGRFGNTVVIGAGGDNAYTRDNFGQFLQGWTYDSATGALGASAFFTTFISDTLTFYGMDQMAIHPTTGQVYVSQPFSLDRFDQTTGAWLGSMPLAASEPTGICFRPTFNEPPECSAAAADPAELWPPNHRFADVSVVGVTDEDGDPIAITIDGILQDEPVNTVGDGNTAPDGAGVGTDTASVRAERSGTPELPEDGRVYTVAFSAEDGQGGACEGSVTVCVPHDQGPGDACVDSGAHFDSTRVACGLGFELAFLLPPILWLSRSGAESRERDLEPCGGAVELQRAARASTGTRST